MINIVITTNRKWYEFAKFTDRLWIQDKPNLDFWIYTTDPTKFFSSLYKRFKPRRYEPKLNWIWSKPAPFMRCRPHNCSKKNGIKTTFHKWDENHLSCKRDFCPCQNSNSSGLSLYPPQCLGFGIKLLQRKKKIISNFSRQKQEYLYFNFSHGSFIYRIVLSRVVVSGERT